METYADRDAVLKRHGYANYENYLRSPRWKAIRERVLKRDSRQCRLCGSPTIIAHHHSYDEPTLLGYSIERIFSLCNACHKSVEFDCENKRTLAEVQAVFAGRLKLAIVANEPKPQPKQREARKCESGPAPAKYERLMAALSKPTKPRVSVDMNAVASGSFASRVRRPSSPLASRVANKKK